MGGDWEVVRYPLLTCDIDPWLTLMMHGLDAREAVPRDVPSDQEHRTIFETNGYQVHVLMGSHTEHLHKS